MSSRTKSNLAGKSSALGRKGKGKGKGLPPKVYTPSDAEEDEGWFGGYW